MARQHLQLKLAYASLIVAVLGTSISPYLFFWQSAHRIEELRAEDLGGDAAPALKRRGPLGAKRKLRNSRIDVVTGMILSVLIMFAIIAATAATLGVHGATINSAADAANALEPVAGNAAGLLFAVGFIGSGILAVPVLAASGSAGMTGLLNKTWGLDHSPRKALFFYALLMVGLIAGTVLSVVDSDPIRLLILSAIVNGIAAGPFLIVVMLISGDRGRPRRRTEPERVPRRAEVHRQPGDVQRAHPGVTRMPAGSGGKGTSVEPAMLLGEGLDFHYGVDVSPIPGVRIQGEAHFSAGCGVDGGLTYWEGIVPDGAWFDASCHLDQAAKFDVSVSSGAAGLNGSYQLAKEILDVIYFQVGPVPVVIVPELVVSVQIDGTLAVNVSFGAEEHVTAGVGVACHDKFIPYAHFDADSDSHHDLPTGDVGATVGGEVLTLTMRYLNAAQAATPVTYNWSYRMDSEPWVALPPGIGRAAADVSSRKFSYSGYKNNHTFTFRCIVTTTAGGVTVTTRTVSLTYIGTPA